jgi:acyl-CoA-binding protein
MRCKGAVLIAGAVGIVSAAAYVYANRKCYQAKLETTRKERGKTGKTGSSYDDPDDYFQDAVAQVSNHGDQLPNTAKLEFYALFKQANFGPCTTPRPSLIDQVARAKWDAWSSLGNLPRDDAQVSYVALVCECFPRFLCDSASESASEGRGTRKKSGGGDGGGGELGFGPVFSVMMQDDSDDTPGLPADGIHNLAKLGHLQPMKAWLRAGGD